jgi:hypothetical protein
MLQRGIALGFWLALIGGFATGARAWAKPGDLPAYNRVECPECGGEQAPRKFALELKITPKGVDIQVGFDNLQPETPPAIDPFFPAFIEYWLQHAGDAITHPDRSLTWNQLWASVPYLRSFPAAAVQPEPTPMTAPPVVKGEAKPVDFEKQLRQLYDAADQYRRTGLHTAARYLYQRVHLLAPTSRLGRLAIEHLQEIESRLRDASEEQGNPDRRDEPETWERDIRNGAIPLGLVCLMY